MKKIIPAMAAILALAACNSNPSSDKAAVNPLDTAGLAEFQKQKTVIVASELDSNRASGAAPGAGAAPTRTRPSSSAPTPAGSREENTVSGGSGSTGTADGSGTTAEPAKKGWSKAAKGAVIGGVSGAAAGAVINKKNPGAGAVIGGAVGAAAGAIIGNEKDKKDGRHQ